MNDVFLFWLVIFSIIVTPLYIIPYWHFNSNMAKKDKLARIAFGLCLVVFSIFIGVWVKL